MFIQLFGNFLVEKAVITEEQKVSFQKELQDTRVKMGTIAVADGLINEAQAEEINHAQTQQDRRFGDIAIEMGYLTDAQISDIIKKQGDSAMKFYQLLTDKAGIAMNDIEANLEEFKKAQGFTDEELDALKRDDIDKIISLYAIVRDTDIPDLASLVMRNLIRFVTSDFYFGRMKKVTDYSYSMLAGQWAVGDKKVYLGFGTSDELDGITKLAKKYAKGVTIAGSDEIYDAVCEFTNLNNGLFASALSEKGTYIDMEPPGVFLNQAISGTAYIMPVYIEGTKIDLIISTEADFSEGTKVHEIKVKKSEIKADNTGGKASVLVVDDSALIRKVLIELLNNNGFNVIGEATNGQEGLDMYKELSPDIVTLDVTMPVMDGVEALRQIIELDANAKVAMITAAGQKERLMEALKIGAKLFITKPFNEEEVLNSLSDLV